MQLRDPRHGRVRQRLVCPGVEDQWLQLGTVYQRDDLTQHDQVIADATASFDCRLWQLHRAGDHLIVLGEVVALVHRPQLDPLIFHAGTYKALAHAPMPRVA